MRYKSLIAVLTVCLVAATAAAGIEDGLAAHYPLDGNADDLSGNGYHATVYGATGTEDRHGTANSAMLFGQSDYAEVLGSEDDFDWAAEDSLTIAAWVRPDQWDVPGWRAVVSTEAPSWKGFGLYRLDDGSAFGLLTSEGFITATAETPVGSWAHLAVVNNREADSVELYLNGVSVGSFAGAGVIDMTSNSSLKIAAQVSNTMRFLGKLDEIHIYDRALSAGEIAAVAGMVGQIFSDGFESGNSSAWSVAIP